MAETLLDFLGQFHDSPLHSNEWLSDHMTDILAAGCEAGQEGFFLSGFFPLCCLCVASYTHHPFDPKNARMNGSWDSDVVRQRDQSSHTRHMGECSMYAPCTNK